MITVKKGVQFSILRPEIYKHFGNFEKAFTAAGFACIITCGTEDHPEHDPHTEGFALDFRTRHIYSEAIKSQIANRIKELIGPDYYVKYEPNRWEGDVQKVNEHIHAQVRRDLWPKLLEAEK